MMIWHIFKKDCRLLWPMILIVAACCAVSVSLWIAKGLFNDNRELAVIANILPLVATLGAVILIVTTIHQDALIGVRQDWLVRPIKRGHLLLAKLLFVLLAVHGPVFLADTVEGLVNGFSLITSVSVALSRGLSMLGSFSLPAMILATVTRNMTNVIVGGLALIVGWIVFTTLITLFGLLPSPELSGTGLTWMIRSIWFALIFLVTAVTLPLQYFRRQTRRSYGVMAGALAVAMLANFLPWKSSFAVQQWLSPQLDAKYTISFDFDPTLGRYQAKPGQSTSFKVETGRQSSIPRSALPAFIYLPVRVSNLPETTVLLADRFDMRVLDAQGKILFSGGGGICSSSLSGSESLNGMCADKFFEVRHELAGDGNEATHQRVLIYPWVYQRIKDQQVRIEIDYWLTIFHMSASNTIPALGGNQHLADLGHCATRMDSDGDDIELRCVNAGKMPTCATAYLEHVPSGLRNPDRHGCIPNYAPDTANIFPDSMSRIGLGAQFYDPAGLAKFPVDGSMLSNARLVLKTYQPQEHLTRRLVIPTIRLSDWTARGESENSVPSASRG